MNEQIIRQKAGLVSAGIVMLFVLAGCTVGPDFEQPDVSSVMQDSWQVAEQNNRFAESGQPSKIWWRQFHDNELTSLVERVFSSNLALKQARQRVIEANAKQGIISSDRRLQVGAALGYTRADTGDEAVSLQGIPPGKTLDVFSAGLLAGWELDLWGRTARLLEAGEEDIRISYDDYHGMLVSLAAETSLAYIEVRTLESRLEMINKSIELQDENLKLARSRFEAGNGTEFAVVQAERLMQSSKSRIPDLTRQLNEAKRRVNLLLGLPPQEKIIGPGKMPDVPQLIGIGLPVDLLTRRADIRRALSGYHAAVARIGAAEAEKYPSLSLSGTLKLSSDSLGGVFDSDALIYTLGPGLQFPLFTGGRISSKITVRQSQAEQARLGLEQQILSALTEVENSAEGVVLRLQQAEKLDQARGFAEKSVTFANELYGSGLSDFSMVIDSEQKLIVIQESLLMAKQQALVQVVRLYRSLGGGWEQAPPALEEDNVAKIQETAL